jgi:hypothetical protein
MLIPRLQRQPRQLPHELNGIPVHRRPHVEADDLDGNEAANQRSKSGPAEVDGTELGIADLAQPVGKPAGAALVDVALDRHPGIDGTADLHLREDVLVLGHVDVPPSARSEG